jgi:hypothetical protein
MRTCTTLLPTGLDEFEQFLTSCTVTIAFLAPWAAPLLLFAWKWPAAREPTSLEPRLVPSLKAKSVTWL